MMFLPAVLAVLALPLLHVNAQSPLPPALLAKVRAIAVRSAQASWEYGTVMQAILELDAPHLAVFEAFSIPPPDNASPPVPADVLDILNGALDSRPAGIRTLVKDGSAGDPASLGVADLLAAQFATIRGQRARYTAAAKSQLDYLLNDAPRNSNGTISHRSEIFQVWSDFVYMGPPFIAYAGATNDDDAKRLFQEAYNQLRGYRAILRDPRTNLWRHVLAGRWQDTSLWNTGNGWAAAGILRVLETIRKSSHNHEFLTEIADMTSWTREIIDAVWEYQLPNGGLRNHIDDESSFEDAAGTALLAAATFRLASITDDHTHISAATKAFELVVDRLDKDGWLTRVVNPYSFRKEGERSPEAQAFVLLLEAAWRAWNASAPPAAADPKARPAAAENYAVVMHGLHRAMTGITPTRHR